MNSQAVTPTVAPRSDGAHLATELIAGSVGGAVQILVGQPLDTLKVRAQTAPPGTFTSTWDIARQTAAKEGVRGFFKGMSSPLIGISAVNSLLFASYGYCKRLINPFNEPLTLPQTALAGAGAGAIQSVLASPVELGKIRMQGQYGGAHDVRLSVALRDLYRQYGWRRGIMRGYWATVAREIPAYAGFYTAYEFTKRSLTPTGSEPTTPIYLASGATGGVCYWLACYPLDVVKSRVQLRQEPPRGGVGYIGRELVAIVRQSGVSGLFRGLGTSLLRSVPAAASTFGAFELTKGFIEKNHLI